MNKAKTTFHIIFDVYKRTTTVYEKPVYQLIAAYQEADVLAYTKKQALNHHAYEIAKKRFPNKIKSNDIIKIVECQY